MPVFPKISLRPEVEKYLKDGFMNKEVVNTLGKAAAERKFETLLKHLSHPPSFTTVRVNTHLTSVQHVKTLLLDEFQKFNGLSVPVLQHPDLEDVLLIPVIGPRKNIKKQQCEAVVGAQCGNAVLRGAHVYVPGIVSASSFMKAGDVISVYSDIKGKCKKGAREFDGTKVFLGNGISARSRKEIFSGLCELKGIGIRMTEPIYLSPSFDNVLPGYLFLQNLPSAVVTHVLHPQPGERVLDLCAAPGGKATHIAALMHDQGEVIALDKIPNKVEKIKQNALLLGLNSIKAFCFDGTKALKHDMTEDTQEGPPFSPESFDRILLDAPCSGMGQRPNMACTWTLKEVMSYQPLQRKLFSVGQEEGCCKGTWSKGDLRKEYAVWGRSVPEFQPGERSRGGASLAEFQRQPEASGSKAGHELFAAQLLKPGGMLVYSTCTITLAENEEQVAWALSTFPCLQLQPQEPRIGEEGMMGAGLSLEQLRQLQRFDPSAVPLQDPDQDALRDATAEDMIRLANKDCIGFFIAKFLKWKSTSEKDPQK
ncbi:tRNA (cytosine(72)-C(5))-methyltransferase NSUN6 isoform X2 [Cavia porcellus]|uniref:tRNA (cytosine(72)-C(5))-methyltransferase NSUN6 isoform X2 n=1 Tax=Cavia porcellus TaxID=10141 RepID=UPI002FDFAD52